MSQTIISELPEEFTSSLIATSCHFDSSLDALAKAVKYMAMVTPSELAQDGTLEEGRYLIQEHLGSLIQYAERIKLEQDHLSSLKVTELEAQLNDLTEFNELQSIVTNPDEYYTSYLQVENSEDSERTRKAFDITIMNSCINRFNALKIKLQQNDKPIWKHTSKAIS
jgi:hypothetical protein